MVLLRYLKKIIII